MNQPITFVGAGPGAEDLITVRGLRALEQADLVVYAGSLVNPAHLGVCRKDCRCLDSASMPLEEQVAVMREAALAGKRVVRLHTGDPSLYGAINEQIRRLAKEGIRCVIVPGVSSVFAAAAALGCELTAPGVSQSVVMTRTPGRTPMPEGEDAAAFARTGATLVFFLSTANIGQLMHRLMEAGGLAADTPAAVVHRASWPDELILRGCVGDIAQKVHEAGLGRQALVLVGRALAGAGADSRLYDAAFSHGYRNSLPSEQFEGRIALYAFTERGLVRAEEIAAGLGAASVVHSTRPVDRQGVVPVPSGELRAYLARVWNQFDAHIFIGATGIAVRTIAPLLQDKTVDPAVLACPENGSHVISLVSGHLGGANRLARRVARITGGEAVISTATDCSGLPALDDVAAEEHARIRNTDAIRPLSAALLAGETLAFCGPEDIFLRHFAACGRFVRVQNPGEVTCSHAVLWDCENTLPPGVRHLDIESRAFVLGVGCRRGTSPETLLHSVTTFLTGTGLRPRALRGIATCTLKADEPAILALGKSLNCPLWFYTPEELNRVPVPTPSKRVLERIGTASVCEAACLLGAGHGNGAAPRLYATKKILGDVTLALARLPHTHDAPEGEEREAAGRAFGTEEAASIPTGEQHGRAPDEKRGEVLVVGLGSGAPDQITPEVDRALRLCDTVAGYTPYVAFVRDRIHGKQILENGMRGELARCRAALLAAGEGKKVCVVCSGDPGILAMAGLLYELRAREARFAGIPVRVLPGITAASLAAASLGAPLQNGFSLVSLSDLLVPTEEVRANLLAVVRSMLPVVLYNPAGRRRRALLGEAIRLFREHRGNVFCAYVKQAGRDGEVRWTGRLADFPEDEVDMSTLVLLGGPRTLLEDGVLYEPRGYLDKYPEQE